LMAMRKQLEQNKVNADINDPVIKKRFEDGMSGCPLRSIKHCV